MFATHFRFEILVLVLAIAGCQGKTEPPSKGPLRPVTYVTLKTMKPSPTNRLTGSAESWKREDIGFEVAGRVLSVVEPGANVVGRTFDEQGELITEGTVLAEVDQERYQIALAFRANSIWICSARYSRATIASAVRIRSWSITCSSVARHPVAHFSGGCLGT